MAEQLYFSRDSKMFVEFKGGVWEIPVLDGFSFSQATNSSEITLSEMESTAGTSRRGRRIFNDSLAPVEWSFSTYMRPFKHSTSYAGEAADSVNNNHHAVEEVLWAMMAGANAYASSAFARGANAVTTTDTTDLDVSFAQSNVSVLETGNLFFVINTDTSDPMVYKLSDAAINEASIDFDVDGIATVNWSGFAKQIFDWTANTTVTGTDLVPASGTVGKVQIDTDTSPYQFKLVTDASTLKTAIDEGTGATNNFVRNRLTQLSITAGNTTTFPGANNNGIYSLTLTGGNVTIGNNITYLVPEELGSVNVPIENVTGARSVSGSFTCYLVFDDQVGGTLNNGTSSDFFADLTSSGALELVNNSFDLSFSIGGSNSPKIVIDMPKSHIEIPSHSIEDVISLETNFHGLGSNLGTADEVTLKYFGP